MVELGLVVGVVVVVVVGETETEVEGNVEPADYPS